MYRRHSFRVYQYEITTDGVAKTVELTYRIDYRRTIANARANGHTMWIRSLGSYIWEE